MICRRCCKVPLITFLEAALFGYLFFKDELFGGSFASLNMVLKKWTIIYENFIIIFFYTQYTRLP